MSADGEIKEEIGLPAALMPVETRFGFEGITKSGDTLWMAVQCDRENDAENQVKLVADNTDSGEFGAVRYNKATPDCGWVGLSEIVAEGDWICLVARDNRPG